MVVVVYHLLQFLGVTDLILLYPPASDVNGIELWWKEPVLRRPARNIALGVARYQVRLVFAKVEEWKVEVREGRGGCEVWWAWFSQVQMAVGNGRKFTVRRVRVVVEEEVVVVVRGEGE